MATTAGRPPPGYTTPPFPSLYWPVRADPHEPAYLYYADDIWRFTLFWSLILFGGFHLASGCYGFCMVPARRALAIPLVFAVVGGIQAAISGSIVGLM